MSFITDLFRSISAIIARLFKSIPSRIREYATKALELTRAIENVVDNGGLTELTKLIPGTWDDKLAERIRIALPRIISSLILLQSTSVDDALQLLIEFLQKQHSKTKNSLLMALASLLVAFLDGEKLKENQYDTFTQIAYSGTKA